MVGVDAAPRAAVRDSSTPSGATFHVVTALGARLGLTCLLLVLAGAAWWLAAGQMATMSAAPGSDLGSAAWFVGVWVVMMAAMMLPSVAPTVALYAQMTRRRGMVQPVLFAAAYLLVWAAVGLVAYAVFEVGRAAFGSYLAWNTGGRWLAAGLVAIAGVYELTPLKNVCLAKCRSPLGFLIGRWRDGPRGAVEMGARHAAWCVGCCWALMTALFALGVMSLVWMAVVAAVIAAEKTLPWRRVVLWCAAAALLTIAVLMLVAPQSVPGLVLPSSGGPVMTMQVMR